MCMNEICFFFFRFFLCILIKDYLFQNLYHLCHGINIYFIQNLASSEEWGDHLQSEVDSTTESSSCGTEPEIAEHEEVDNETDAEMQFGQMGQGLGMTTSNLNAMNILTVNI